ncbi:MAG TPA: hypothetical protein VGX23_33690 [Actinocrinis sp.]|nr:hypothetical protein [Actinocrinis sp.]
MAAFDLIAKILFDSARIAAAAQQKREKDAARVARAKAVAERQAKACSTPATRTRNPADRPSRVAPAEYRGVPVHQRAPRPSINDPQTLAEFRRQAR